MGKTLLHILFPNISQRALLSLWCRTHSVIFYHQHRLMLLQVPLCSGGPWPQKPGNQHEVWIVFHQKTVGRVTRGEAETPVLLPSWGTTGKMLSTTQWQGFTACIQRGDLASGSLCCSFKSRHCHLFPKPSRYAKKEQGRKGLMEVTPATVSHQQPWLTKRTL